MNPIQQQIEQNEREFEEKFDTSGKKTYIGARLQYEDKNGDILFTIDDVKSHLHTSQLAIIKAVVESIQERKNLITVYDEGEQLNKKYIENDLLDSLITRLNELLDNK